MDLQSIRDAADDRKKQDGYTWMSPEHVLGMVSEIEKLRAAAGELVANAESMITTDVAGNRFQKVFTANLDRLRGVLEQKAHRCSRCGEDHEPRCL